MDKNLFMFGKQIKLKECILASLLPEPDTVIVLVVIKKSLFWTDVWLLTFYY